MDHVRYIDKTRDYYRREGYLQDYRWAHFTDGPFTPLRKPLPQSRALLISTASLVRLDAQGAPLDRARVIGTNALEVFPLPMDWPPERLRSVSTDHDRFQTDMADLGAYFPVAHLRRLVEEGRLGSLAADALRILPNYSHRKVLQLDAPEVLRIAREQGVDVALLAPV